MVDFKEYEQTKLEIIKSELETLKPNAKVYTLKSNIFFLDNKDQIKAEVDKSLRKLTSKSK